MTRYTITLKPVSRPGESEWLVEGGSQTYTVRRNSRGEFTCNCPNHFFRVGSRAREGHQCKHVNLVRCEIGDHKFLPSLSGMECVRCGMSEAEFEFREYGPPNPGDWEEAMGGAR